MNGFGSFNLRVNGPMPPNGLGSFMFTISRTNGDPISVSELVGNLPVGVHFIDLSAGFTGFSSVSEPGTLVLLGTGLLAMGSALSRRMQP